MDDLEAINNFIESLPSLDQHTILKDVCCPICLVPFEDISKAASASDKPLRGLTMLPACQHVFCRNDLIEWIRGMHGSCPSCRHVFLNIRQPSESDEELSDDDEYLPNEDEEDEDPMTDADDFYEMDEFGLEMEEVDLNMYLNWEPSEIGDGAEDASSEWGLTDEESLSHSDGDMSFESDPASLQNDADIVIRDDVDDESPDFGSSNDDEK